jgi:hypothetical protein
MSSIISKALISLWNKFSPYKIGTVKKKLVFKNFDESVRFFLIVEIDGEECDFEVTESFIKGLNQGSLIVAKCITYQNSNYICNIL